MDKKNNKKHNENKDKKKVTSKQAAAIVGIVLLVLMYVVTLIVSIVDRSGSGRLLRICLGATFAVPLLLWIYIWMYGKLTRKHTIADLDIGGADTGEEKGSPVSGTQSSSGGSRTEKSETSSAEK